MAPIYIGIDIAKASFTVALPLTNGHFLDYSLPNNPAGFSQLLDLLPAHSQCVLEASGPYYLPLALWLTHQRIPLSVLNPLVVRRFAQMLLRRTKTDKADARLLSQFGANQTPPCWQAPTTLMSQLTQLQTLLEQYINQRTALRNQQEAFTHSGVPNPILEQSLQKSLEHLDEQIQTLEQQLDQLANTEYTKLYAHLQSIPGIGRKTALCLLVLTRGFSRFESAKQLVSFVGLAPRVFESGSSVNGKGHICKLGNNRIRQLLYMASMQAKKANPACRSLYDRLVGAGKPKLVALIAVAHKLVRQCFAVARSGLNFDQKLASPIAS
ncbi:IS110 family RNA-guided transposase [Spirosoma aerolatum]|uniref:IS110 family transposase n=1 Tax=Spirosoma aerolatum TaxID=1211326 RepID=UPI0009AC4642|nr:IS110 family transposase [Spirosoma aerolatum]